MVNYQDFLQEIGRWLQLGLFSAFVVGCYVLWMQTYCISKGHYWIGQLAMLILIIAALLMAFGPERTMLFWIMVFSSLCLWIFYNGWYFYRYPIPKEYLQASGRKTTQQPFVPKYALARALSAAMTTKPFWFRSWFRYTCIVVMLALAGAYGFSRWVNAYTVGQRKLVEQQKHSEQQTKQAVSTAIQSATTAVQHAVDTLAQNQQEVLEKTDAILNQPKTKAVPVRQKRKQPVSSGSISLPPQPIQPKPVTPVKPHRSWWPFGLLHTRQAEPDTIQIELAKQLY